jgi:hypothetical protein
LRSARRKTLRPAAGAFLGGAYRITQAIFEPSVFLPEAINLDQSPAAFASSPGNYYVLGFLARCCP